MSELVSVVIPTFNYGRFVARAVRSVLGQTYHALQCIVVDDGSTDNTLDVLRGFGSDIEVVRQSNLGLSAARNTGVGVARGPYIAFLDADDEWLPLKIEEQLKLLKHSPGVGCVGCGREIHYVSEGRSIFMPGQPNPGTRERTIQDLARRRFWVGGSGSGCLLPRSVIERVGGFDTALWAAEDWDYWMRVAAIAGIDNVPDILMIAHRHSTGVFRNPEKFERYQLAVYQKATAAWPDVLTPAIRREMRALIQADAGGEFLDRGDRWQALKRYARSIAVWPFQTRSWRVVTSIGVRSLIFGADVHRRSRMTLRELLKSSSALVGLVKDLRKLRHLPRLIRALAVRETMIRDYVASHEIRKLEIGAGHHDMPGWLVTDVALHSSNVVLLDATKPFPFPDETFHYVHSEHMIEHVTWQQGQSMLAECWRVLKKGGKIRIATPDLAMLMALYGGTANGRASRYIKWATDMHCRHAGVYKAALVINSLFYGFGHHFLYDLDLLETALSNAGFTNITSCEFNHSADPHLTAVEGHGAALGSEEIAGYETVVVEAERPV